MEPLKLLDGHWHSHAPHPLEGRVWAGEESRPTTSASVCAWLRMAFWLAPRPGLGSGPGHLAGCGYRCGYRREYLQGDAVRGRAGCVWCGILMNRNKLAPRWQCRLPTAYGQGHRSRSRMSSAAQWYRWNFECLKRN